MTTLIWVPSKVIERNPHFELTLTKQEGVHVQREKSKASLFSFSKGTGT